jgi:hypothetical protein
MNRVKSFPGFITISSERVIQAQNDRCAQGQLNSQDKRSASGEKRRTMLEARWLLGIGDGHLGGLVSFDFT